MLVGANSARAVSNVQPSQSGAKFTSRRLWWKLPSRTRGAESITAKTSLRKGSMQAWNDTFASWPHFCFQWVLVPLCYVRAVCSLETHWGWMSMFIGEESAFGACTAAWISGGGFLRCQNHNSHINSWTQKLCKIICSCVLWTILQPHNTENINFTNDSVS